MTADTPVRISRNDRAAFDANGFLTIREFAEPADVARLRPLFERLCASPIGTTTADRSDIIGDVGRHATVPQITHLERYTSALMGSPVRERAFEIARELLGDDIVLDCETMIAKLPGSPDATPWHQDEAFWPAEWTRDAVSFWIPLQDVDVDGGCMEFIPGSHLGEVRPHRPMTEVESGNAFEMADLDTRFRTVCALPVGAATVHHSRTAHSTGPNRSTVTRYAYILVFSGPGRSLPEPRDFPWQGARGRDDRRRASYAGLGGFVTYALRGLAIVVTRLNAENDRRRWNAKLRLDGSAR